MTVFVFDIETVPDVEAGRRLLKLGQLSDNETADAMFAARRDAVGHDFLAHHLHQVVCISVVMASAEQLKVWSLGDSDAEEKELIQRFFAGIEKYTPTLVSWNGGGFDLPVLHYRALRHGVVAERYWDQGEEGGPFRWNNYLSRFHCRHLDLMDVLSGYQPRASARLDDIASLLGYPGKMGQSGGAVWSQFLRNERVAIRDYCETDVLNTYLVYLSFQRLRGRCSEAEYDLACQRLRDYLRAQQRSHFEEFLAAWPEDFV